MTNNFILFTSWSIDAIYEHKIMPELKHQGWHSYFFHWCSSHLKSSTATAVLPRQSLLAFQWCSSVLVLPRAQEGSVNSCLPLAQGLHLHLFITAYRATPDILHYSSACHFYSETFMQYVQMSTHVPYTVWLFKLRIHTRMLSPTWQISLLLGCSYCYFLTFCYPEKRSQE